MMPPGTTLRIGIVAGEASGDILGAGLIAALRQQCPELVVEGIGGPLMLAEGCHSFFPQDRLAVMGLVEPLKRLPELLRIRRFLREYFVANPPDVFIGIDSPDFNLSLEQSLHETGIRTVHYVSPSVWAWRQGRLKKIARAVDLVLTLFPFEESSITSMLRNTLRCMRFVLVTRSLTVFPWKPMWLQPGLNCPSLCAHRPLPCCRAVAPAKWRAWGVCFWMWRAGARTSAVTCAL